MSATPAPEATAPGFKLLGRVALVTGASRGIGAAIAKSLAGQGATIAAGYSSNDEAAKALKDEIEGMGVAASVHRGNVARAEDCRRTVGEVVDTHGRLDILVNNAGITADKSALKMEDEDWNKVIAVNLSGTFFMCKAVLGHMLDRGTGRIVNISSVVGQMGNIGQVNYAASKSGLFGLTTTLAREVAAACQKGDKLDAGGVGITVNAVAPGFIETDMTSGMPDKVLEKVTAQIPLGRLGKPEEVARVVHFLCADAGSYVTGQVWAVNGGMEM